MSREAQRLADLTGCLPSEAAAALTSMQSPEEARGALEAVMLHRRRLYGPFLLAVWSQFTDPTSPELGIDETIAFIQALGLQLEDPLVLVIAYELQAPETGRFVQQKFIDGWARLEVKNLDEMRYLVPTLAERFRDLAYFRLVYRYTYRFVMASENTRTMPVEVAVAYWELLLAPRYPRIIDSWLKFCKCRGGISMDTWNMLLEFCEYAERDPQFKEYDATSAWPAVFDEYVEAMTENSAP